MKKSSPEYLQVSLAAAMTLGLSQGKFYRDAKLYCLNLLLTYPGGCRAACEYCGLSRANESSDNFIRVQWPVYPVSQIIDAAVECAQLERVCISTLTHPDNTQDTIKTLKRFRSKTSLPISILSNPTTTSVDDIKALRDEGADRFTVAVDLATPELFKKYRGVPAGGPHTWDRYWSALKTARDIFGAGKIGAHLIAGLGETEKQIAVAIQEVSDLGGATHLFSFYPEAGSVLKKMEACPPGQYRRIQLIRYLIDGGFSSYGKMSFDDNGRLADTGIDSELYNSVIDSGKPFETCGCPGENGRETACNRPYGDGPPSDIKSYPFPLEPLDVKHVRRQMKK